MGFERLLFRLMGLLLLAWKSQSLTLSSRLVHRFSDESRSILSSRAGQDSSPSLNRGHVDYYKEIFFRDLQRRKNKIKVGHRVVFPSEGSEAVGLGNDYGWLHYTRVDIGTPNVSFLVALDAGSDLFWVPCDCVQCAGLSSDRNGLDKVLSMYHPTTSSSSKHLPCGHELCSSGSSTCESPNQPCPYSVNYYSENTSSSGVLMQDTLYLASSDSSAVIRASVIIGCGSRQSGGYLDGIAPDGLLGLGPGKISVPSILAREGLVRDSFSLCFEEDDSGRILFGDQGVSDQLSTPFVPMEGRYPTYIVQVEGWCIGSKCLGETATKALLDCGSSFTYLPDSIFVDVVSEFDRQMNHSSITYEGSPFQYCYRASSFEVGEVPNVRLMLSVNQSFPVKSPFFFFNDHEGKREAFCLALQPTEDSHVTIGQNFMTGYRLVFDRERMRLAWSPSSHCEDPTSSRHLPTQQPYELPENHLPTAGGPPGSTIINPAVAGHAPSTGIAAPLPPASGCCFIRLLLFLLAFSVVISTG